MILPWPSFISNYRSADQVRITQNKTESNGIGEQVGTAIIKEEEVVAETKKIEIVEENSIPIPHIVEGKVETVTKEVAQVTAILIDPVGSILDGSTSAEEVEAAAPIDDFTEDGIPKRISNIEIPDPELEAFIVSEPQDEFETMIDPNGYVNDDDCLTFSPLIPYPPPHRPYIHLTGFKFCDVLENATFFTDLELDVPGINDY